MGIQINGQTDTITAIDGQMTISGTDLSTDSISLSTINATGVSTFAGNIDANGDLDVDGHTELDAVNVSGFLTATSAYYSGDVTVLGTLTYEDVVNVDSVGIATARAGLRINGGGLYVTGVSTFNGDLSITDKIVHEGDTDTAIRFPANDTITAETGGSERLRITSGGNIGIGTDDPDGKLNIYSTNPTRVVIEGDGSSTASAALVLKSNDETSNYRATGVFYYDTLSQTEWFSGRPYTGSDTFAIHRKTNLGGSTGNSTAHPDNTLFLINSSGNIGIGSHNPGVILDVREKKTAGSTQIRLYNTDNSNTTTQTAEVSLTPDSRALAGAGIKVFKENADFSTNANRDISLALNVVQNNSQTEALRITSGGQLNINASSESLGGKVVIKNNVDYTATEFDDNPTLYLLNGDQTTGISEASIVFAGRNTGGSTYRAAISGNGSTGLKFYTTSNVDQNDDPAMIIRGSGNIGIGTDNPESLLHIKGTTGKLIVEDTNGAPTITMKNVGTNSSDDGLGSFTFTNTGYSGVSGIAARTASNGSGAILQFLSGASAEAMRLDGSGRLLIGATSAPLADANAPLQLVRSATGPKLIFARNDTSVAAGEELGVIRFYGNDADGTYQNCAQIGVEADLDHGTNDKPTRILFSTTADAASSPTERMRISSSGRVSIPLGGSLELQAGNAEGLRLSSASSYLSSGQGPWISFNGGPFTGWDTARIQGIRLGSNAEGGLLFYTNDGGGGAGTISEKARIDNSGNLYSYQTYANVSASAANVGIAAGGNFFRSTSFGKYKTAVETIQDSYADALLECRPVWYRSLCETDNSEHSYWGFIAEEVAAIDPRLVHWKTFEVTHDEDGKVIQTPCDPEPEGVAYDRFVPHLINLVKRQKEQIETQAASIAALEARLTALEGQ